MAPGELEGDMRQGRRQQGRDERHPAALMRLGFLPLLLFLMVAPLLPLLPLPITADFPLVDWQRVAELAALATAAVLFAIWTRAWHGNAAALAMVAACLAAGALSVLQDPAAQRESWRDWLLWTVLIITVWGGGLAVSADRAAFERSLARSLALAAGAFVVWFLLTNAVVYLARPPGQPAHVVILGFGNIRSFSDWQTFILPFLPAAIASCGRARWWRAALLPLAFIFYSLAFHAQSRSLFLGQFAAHASLWILMGRRYGPAVRDHGYCWLGGLVAFALVRLAGWQAGTQGGMDEGLVREGLSGRGELWLQALQLSLAHPLLGVGPGRFSLYPNPFAAGPHNTVLMLAAEWGWPVALAATSFMLAILWRAARCLRPPSAAGTEVPVAPATVAAWLATVALLVQSLVSGVVVAPLAQVCVVLGMAWLLGAADAVRGRGIVAARGLVVSVTAAVLVSLGAIAVADIRELPQANARYRACLPPPVRFYPRFWLQGWLFDPCDPALAGAPSRQPPAP